jgi:hypothetical protein
MDQLGRLVGQFGDKITFFGSPEADCGAVSLADAHCVAVRSLGSACVDFSENFKWL